MFQDRKTSLKDSDGSTDIGYKSAFSRCNNTKVIEKNLIQSETYDKDSDSVNSTPQSVKIDTLNNSSPVCDNSPSAHEPSFYFSPISSDSSENMDMFKSAEALDEFKNILVSSPKPHKIHSHHHSYHKNPGCNFSKKRAHSLTNPNVVTQFQLENQLGAQILKIYGSSKEFLANLDNTSAIGTKHEADFATSHHFLTNMDSKEFNHSPQPARKDSNANIKILDKNHKNQNDNILTVFGKCLNYSDSIINQ